MTLQKQDLIQFFADSAKPKAQHRVGVEHEIFLYDNDGKRLNYEGVRCVLEAFVEKGWQGVYEKENLIAAKHPSGANITLEPGGQFELSGAPLDNLHQIQNELSNYHADLEEILSRHQITKKFLGFEPTWEQNQIPWMPKGRYGIMKAYLPTRGGKALDMMLRTCTVQANFDYENEADMVRKMRVSVALQPLITALFANSSMKERKPSGFKSYRAFIWQDTDPDRCGFLDFVFDKNMGYERYVDYLLSIPMFFIYRDGIYHSAAGESFERYMNGQTSFNKDFTPTLSDWADHTTIAFPEVRLKQYIEMRGADCVPPPKLMLLPAFWTGLLYDEQSLEEVEKITEAWPVKEIKRMSLAVPKEGLDFVLEGKTISKWLDDIFPIAKNGLERRAILNTAKEDESIYLCLEETGKQCLKQII